MALFFGNVALAEEVSGYAGSRLWPAREEVNEVIFGEIIVPGGMLVSSFKFDGLDNNFLFLGLWLEKQKIGGILGSKGLFNEDPRGSGFEIETEFLEGSFRDVGFGFIEDLGLQDDLNGLPKIGGEIMSLIDRYGWVDGLTDPFKKVLKVLAVSLGFGPLSVRDLIAFSFVEDLG